MNRYERLEDCPFAGTKINLNDDIQSGFISAATSNPEISSGTNIVGNAWTVPDIGDPGRMVQPGVLPGGFHGHDYGDPIYPGISTIWPNPINPGDNQDLSDILKKLQENSEDSKEKSEEKKSPPQRYWYDTVTEWVNDILRKPLWVLNAIRLLDEDGPLQQDAAEFVRTSQHKLTLDMWGNDQVSRHEKAYDVYSKMKRWLTDNVARIIDASDGKIQVQEDYDAS